ncbi:MAG: ubiquinone biosynthesis protein UbiH [Betaproteobacteria bacterium RIFCSPLOWO2_12_FULL_62_13]|nr:MAG: ubiquinone biosynthesis protein UbiH [Betaproteobacteria bacterium RIFCSPLOWO2_12_FULL_62_13]
MSSSFDVIIVGGGLVGASLAAALGPAEVSVALVEPQPPRPLPADDSWDSRVYAISPGAAAFLESCGAWQRVPPQRVTRIEAMQVYGDDPAARLDFSAYDAGLRELAFVVENRLLQDALWQGLHHADHVRVFSPARCAAMAWEPAAIVLRLEDGTELTAKLVVGADGADSWVRAQAGISAVPRDYGQLGVVANFATGRPHRGTAFQWFRRGGVLALLPLPGNRASLVWSTAEAHGRELLGLAADELQAQVESASHEALGALELITPPAAFPLQLQRVARLVQPRLALAGDAAHNVHPLAGQGVNLGLRDARELAAVLRERGAQADCGDYFLLRRYERARREDILALQLTTDGLQKLFGSDVVWLAMARNLGLRLVNLQPPLKNLLVRRAVA